MTAQQIIDRLKEIDVYVLDDDIRLYHQYLSPLKEAEVLDLGTGWGKSCLAMALCNPKLRIFTIDDGSQPIAVGWAKNKKEYRQKLERRFEEYGAVNTMLFVEDGLTLKLPNKFDVLHIDMMAEFEEQMLKKWFPNLKSGGILLIRNYQRFKKAADEICQGCEYREKKGLIQVVVKK